MGLLGFCLVCFGKVRILFVGLTVFILCGRAYWFINCEGKMDISRKVLILKISKSEKNTNLPKKYPSLIQKNRKNKLTKLSNDTSPIFIEYLLIKKRLSPLPLD